MERPSLTAWFVIVYRRIESNGRIKRRFDRYTKRALALGGRLFVSGEAGKLGTRKLVLDLIEHVHVAASAEAHDRPGAVLARLSGKTQVVVCLHLLDGIVSGCAQNDLLRNDTHAVFDQVQHAFVVAGHFMGGFQRDGRPYGIVKVQQRIPDPELEQRRGRGFTPDTHNLLKI